MPDPPGEISFVKWTNHLYRQLRYGCQDESCRNRRTCHSAGKSRPHYRRPGCIAARALAAYIVASDDFRSRSCHSPLDWNTEPQDLAFSSPLVSKDSSGLLDDIPRPCLAKVDVKSLTQRSFTSEAWSSLDQDMHSSNTSQSTDPLVGTVNRMTVQAMPVLQKITPDSASRLVDILERTQNHDPARRFVLQSIAHVFRDPLRLTDSFVRNGSVAEGRTSLFEMYPPLPLSELANLLRALTAHLDRSKQTTILEHLNICLCKAFPDNSISIIWESDTPLPERQAFHLFCVSVAALLAFLPQTGVKARGWLSHLLLNATRLNLSEIADQKEREQCVLLLDAVDNNVALQLLQRVANLLFYPYEEHTDSDNRGRGPVTIQNDLQDSFIAWLEEYFQSEHIKEATETTANHIWELYYLLKSLLIKTLPLGRLFIPCSSSSGTVLHMMQRIDESLRPPPRSRDLGIVYSPSELILPYIAASTHTLELAKKWHITPSKDLTIDLIERRSLHNLFDKVHFFRMVNFSRMAEARKDARTELLMLNRSSYVPQLLALQDQVYFERRPAALTVQQEEFYAETTIFLSLNIRRSEILEDAMAQLWDRKDFELHKPLKVKIGADMEELGVDAGGVQQEFFRLALAELLNPVRDLFWTDEQTSCSWFQPLSHAPLRQFELAGLLIGMALYNGLSTGISFPTLLYTKLTGRDDETYLTKELDGCFVSERRALEAVERYDGDRSDLALSYAFLTERYGQSISIDMRFQDSERLDSLHDDSYRQRVEAGLVDVTNDNYASYVKDYKQWLAHLSIKPQYEAFQRGFLRVITRRSLEIFEPWELKHVAEGEQHINRQALRAGTSYDGYEPNERIPALFWRVVDDLSDNEMRQLLEFVTASDRVPVQGAQALHFKFKRGPVSDQALPTSHTCFSTLVMPVYSEKEIMEQKLKLAIANSLGFGIA